MASNEAVEVRKAERKLYSRPVFVQGIMQPTLHQLTHPCDVEVRGIVLRLSAGTGLCILSGGSHGLGGCLTADVYFRALDGQTYRADAGTQITVPALD